MEYGVVKYISSSLVNHIQNIYPTFVHIPYTLNIYLPTKTLPNLPPPLLINLPNPSLRRLNRPPNTLINLMLLHLRLHIIRNTIPHTRPADPIHDTPGSEIPLRTAEKVNVCSAGDAAEEETRRHDCVAGEGECFFDGDDG